MFLADTTNSTPFIITFLSLLGSVLVVVLTQVASKLYRNADKSLDITCYRMPMLDKRTIKIRLLIQNTTGNVTHLTHFALLRKKGRKYEVISTSRDMPIQADRETSFIYGDKQSGYGLRIAPNKKYNVVLDFPLEGDSALNNEDKTYFFYINKRGKKRVSSVDLFTSKTQTLHFHNQK